MDTPKWKTLSIKVIAFGCIFSPVVKKCDESKDYSNKVSKLALEKDSNSEGELNMGVLLNSLDPEFKHKVRERMILSTMRIYATNFDSVNIASIITDRSDDLFDYKYQIDKDTISSYYKKYYESKFEPSKGILFTNDELSQ